MSIAEEIKSKFPNNYVMAAINVLYTHNWLQSKFTPIFKGSKITSQQYNVLRILKGKHPNTCAAHDIKDVMLDKSPDLTRLLDRLLEKDLIKRAVCGENRRQLDISISGKGLELLKKLGPKVMDHHRKHQNNLTDEESKELSRLLDKMRG